MNIELRMRGMQAMLNRLTRVEKEYRSPGALKAQLGRILVRQTKHRIEEEKAAPDGTAWRPWSREYAATRGPSWSPAGRSPARSISARTGSTRGLLQSRRSASLKYARPLQTPVCLAAMVG